MCGSDLHGSDEHKQAQAGGATRLAMHEDAGLPLVLAVAAAHAHVAARALAAADAPARHLPRPPLRQRRLAVATHCSLTPWHTLPPGSKAGAVRLLLLALRFKRPGRLKHTTHQLAALIFLPNADHPKSDA